MALPKIKDVSFLKKKGSQKERRNPIRAIPQYLSDVRSEFKKVIWPSRADIVSATIVVLVTLAFFIVFIGIFDFLFSNLITTVLP